MHDRTYVVWEPASGQTFVDGLRIPSDSPQHAAERWADWNDCIGGKYCIFAGDHVALSVRNVDGGETWEMVVCGESVRKYTAKLRVRDVPKEGI